MSFAQPNWLYALAVILPALILIYIRSEKRMQSRLRTFAASKLASELVANYSPVRQRLKMGIVLLSVLFIAIALARPQYGVVLEESEARGIDLLIALDTSRSMLAEDVKPSRLERSKLAVLDLVNAIHGDRVGLVAFAGDAFLQCPLTLDYDAFRATLEATDTRIIARGGTNIAAAIEEGRKALGEDRNFKLLVLITDGEDLEASGLAAAREAAEAGLRIFTVGVGGTSGEPIPIRDAKGNPDYLRDASGRIVRSALDEQTLQTIAATSNGIYTPLGASGGGLQKVYQQLISELPAEELGTRMQEIPLERYQWPLLSALILLFLEPLFGTRKRQRIAAGSSAAILPLLALLFIALPTPAPASPGDAMRLYEKGDYTQAVEILQAEIKNSPDDARLHYNLGNVYYRLKSWDEARREFDRALSTKDPALQADAFFNLGNTLYMQGMNAPDTVDGREEQLSKWEEALRAYQNSAALQSDRPDLDSNRNIVQQAIAIIARQLTVLVDPADAGTAGPSGLFVAGAEVELKASPNPGWMFREWKDAEVEDPSKETTHVTLEEDTTAVARFVKTWHLEVLSSDEEKGTAEKTGDYPEDEPAKISATAKEPYVFHNWVVEGAKVSPADQANAQVSLTQNAKVTAVFTPGFFLEVVPEPNLGGFPGQTGWYKQFSDVPISSEVREGFEWIGWNGDDIEDISAESTKVALTSSRKVTAHYHRLWSLIVAESDRQGGTVTGSGNFPIGAVTPITATPNEGYSFVQWHGKGIEDPTNAETSVTVGSREHDVIAEFKKDDSQDDSEQNQDQENQDQDQQDQNQDSENQDQQEQDQQDQEENQEPQDQEQAQESEEDPEEAQPEQAQDDQQGEETEEEASEEKPAEPRQAGEMTEEEARQFLNALRESEKKLPAVRRVRPGDDTTGRDW